MTKQFPPKKLRDFFKYFDAENPNHIAAVDQLQSDGPGRLWADDSNWVKLFRTPVDKPKACGLNPSDDCDCDPKPEWPLTKEQLGEIMLCNPGSLPDSLMDDLARCVSDCSMDKLELVYFLGQVGHESAGLRYPMEIHDGSNYEGRTDLGNTQPGDGVKYAGTGFIQVTGAYWHKEFTEFIGDPKVYEIGKTYTAEKYPWSISAFWWLRNNMKQLCAAHPACTNSDIDTIGARVNGRNRPNGADDRIAYTDRAYKTLIGI